MYLCIARIPLKGKNIIVIGSKICDTQNTFVDETFDTLYLSVCIHFLPSAMLSSAMYD